MARIAGVVLPENKRIEFALTYVYGIGLKSAQEILNKLRISFDKRTRELTNDEVGAIQQEVTSNYMTEGDLRKDIMLNIKRLQEIGCYRGLRHKKGLPVRGQRSKTNAKTQKRIGYRIGK